MLGRALFNRTSVTSRCEGIAALAGSAYIALHPEDARRLGVRPGDLVAVSSDGAGEILAVARFTEAVPPGQAFIPLGYEEAPANALVLPDRPYTYVRVKTLVRT